MSHYAENGNETSATPNNNENDSKVTMSVQWTEHIYEKQKRPTLRNSHNVCSDSKHKTVYLFGGRSKGGANNHLYSLSLDSLNRGWEIIETGGTIPTPRKSAALAYCAGYLYLFGGNYKDQLLSDFFAFRVGLWCFYIFLHIFLVTEQLFFSTFLSFCRNVFLLETLFLFLFFSLVLFIEIERNRNKQTVCII